jgi:ubiquitin C-terminal hydrolase
LSNLANTTKLASGSTLFQRDKTTRDNQIFYPYSLYGSKEGDKCQQDNLNSLSLRRESSSYNTNVSQHPNNMNNLLFTRQISARQRENEILSQGNILTNKKGDSNEKENLQFKKENSEELGLYSNPSNKYSLNSNSTSLNNNSVSSPYSLNYNNSLLKNNHILTNNSRMTQNENEMITPSNNRNIMSNITNSSVLNSKKIGLENLGNTCFMNTGLQCLLHTEPFIKRFLQEKGNYQNGSNSTSQVLYDLCKEMIEKGETGRSSISPYNFKRVFGSKHEIFSGYSQHDTQEFLRILLDDISQEMNRVKIIPKYRELDSKIKDKVKLNTEYDKLYKERENSIVIDTFTVQLVNIFTCCDCGYETYSFDKLIDIPLLLDSDNYSGFTLFSLLDKFFTMEKIKWETPCENSSCKKKSFHNKIVRLSICPEILVFSIQRNNGRVRRKNTSPVSFEEEIDVSKYFDKDCQGYFR